MTSIIILVQDRYDFFMRCVTSILEHTFSPYEFIFIVQGKVDDRIIEWINNQKIVPQVVIFNEINNGVTPGRNQGIEVASGEYLLFFDDDAYVNDLVEYLDPRYLHMDWLSRMRSYYDVPQVGIVSQSGSWINPKHMGVFYVPAPMGRYPVGQFCDVGQGYCFMFSRAVVNAIGGLDPYFGKFWHEESEYALRAKYNGFKVIDAGYIGVYHEGSGSGDDGTYGDKINYLSNKWSPHFPQILEMPDWMK
jgi:O-antigen biosynthesis protein